MPLALRGSGPDPAQMGVQEQITSGDLDGAGADELVGNGVGELVIVGVGDLVGAGGGELVGAGIGESVGAGFGELVGAGAPIWSVWEMWKSPDRIPIGGEVVDAEIWLAEQDFSADSLPHRHKILAERRNWRRTWSGVSVRPESGECQPILVPNRHFTRTPTSTHAAGTSGRIDVTTFLMLCWTRLVAV